MWKAACLWLRSPRASNLLLSRTTSGTSRPAVHSLGRGEKCMLMMRNEKFILICTFLDDVWIIHVTLPPLSSTVPFLPCHLLHVQVVPGSRVDDVTPACEMMPSDFDQECAVALWCFYFCLQTNLNWRWGRGCLTEGPLFPVMLTWADCCRDLILSSLIIYFKLVLNSEPKKKWDLLWRTEDNNRLMLFKKQITARFSFNKTGQQPTWNSTKT